MSYTHVKREGVINPVSYLKSLNNYLIIQIFSIGATKPVKLIGANGKNMIDQ